ncbi:DUF6281 family protein [Streptomyces sp. NPDC054887]
MSVHFTITRGRLVRTLVLAAAATTAAVGCTSSSGGGDAHGGGGSASCAYRVTYEGRTYGDVANIDFEVGKKIGTVSLPPCDDTGSQEKAVEPTESVAYAVEGLDPAVAIAVGSAPEDAIFVAVDPGRKLPAEVEKLRRNGS